jgi:hypothetical protein
MLKWIFGGGLISLTLFAFSIHFGKVDVHINIGNPISAGPTISPKTPPSSETSPKPSTFSPVPIPQLTGPSERYPTFPLP